MSTSSDARSCSCARLSWAACGPYGRRSGDVYAAAGVTAEHLQHVGQLGQVAQGFAHQGIAAVTEEIEEDYRQGAASMRLHNPG
jgi:hypothetical protein